MAPRRGLLDLTPEEVGTALEAAVALAVARLALRLFPLEALARSARKLARASAGPRTPSPPPLLEPLVWPVDAAANLLGATCLPRSLALLWALARAGVEADLCLGVRAEGTPLPGHAWVEVGTRPLGQGPRDDLAGPGAASFALLCRLPRRDVSA